MLVNPTFTGFVEFCTTGSRSAPGSSLLSSGYLASEILPAEQFNWLLNRASKGITDDETYLVNINAELNAVLVNLNTTYSGASDQLSNKITAAATADTLMKRDAAGRAQIISPSADADIANRGWTRDFCIPIGMVYIQGPNDAAPGTLWPGTTWSNVSSEEAGLFRRFEGGSALGFGAGTQGNQNLSHAHSMGNDNTDHSHSTTITRGWGGEGSTNGTTRVTVSGSAGWGSGGRSAYHQHTINANGGTEARPSNVTVRKWRRTA